MLEKSSSAEQRGDDNATESGLPHLAPPVSHGMPGGLQVGMGMRAARLLRIRLAEPLPGRAGDPGHRSERGADGATLLLGRKANLLLHWAMSVCVRGLVALYGTLPEARDEYVRPLGRQVPVGPRARTGRRAGPGNGLRTVAWTPSVDGSVTAKLGSCAEGCKFVWASGPHKPRAEMLRPQPRPGGFRAFQAPDQGERAIPGFGGRLTIRSGLAGDA